VTLAEASLVFTRERQIFASTLGSLIDQTRTTSGAASRLTATRAMRFKSARTEFVRGQHQLKGYELIATWR